MSDTIAFLAPGIIFLVVLFIIYYIYGRGVDKGEKSSSRYQEAEKKASEEMAEFKKDELLFQQFEVFIRKVFNENEKVSRNELFNLLSSSFSGYKNGDTHELFNDLRHTGLIAADKSNDDYFGLGRVFDDLRFVNPELLDFLKSKSNIVDSFHHDMHGKGSICEASIKKDIDHRGTLKYFVFGVCKGTSLKVKLKIINDHIDLKEIYIYSYAYYTERYSTDNNTLYFFKDFMKIEKYMNYQNILNNWIDTAISRCLQSEVY